MARNQNLAALFAFLSLALLLPTLQAAPAAFTMNWKTIFLENNTYVSSDMDALPSVAVPSSVCVGNAIPITLTSTGGWRVTPSLFDGGTSSGALSPSDPITSYNQPAGTYAIRWSTNSQVQQLKTYSGTLGVRKWEWQPNNNWASYLTGTLGVSDYSSYEKEVGIKYREHGGGTGFYNSGQKY
jgi:hypothetical protein